MNSWGWSQKESSLKTRSHTDPLTKDNSDYSSVFTVSTVTSFINTAPDASHVQPVVIRTAKPIFAPNKVLKQKDNTTVKSSTPYLSDINLFLKCDSLG